MTQYNEILRVQSYKIEDLLSDGYYISEGYQRNGYTDITLLRGQEIATVTVTDKFLSDTYLKDPLVDTTVYTVTYAYRESSKASIQNETLAFIYEPTNWYGYAPKVTTKYSDLEDIARAQED